GCGVDRGDGLRRSRRLALDQTMREHEVRRLGPEISAQAGRPPLVLGQGACEARIAGLSELELGPAPRLDLQVAEALTHEQLLELRVLLQIVRLVAEARKAERWGGDGYVYGLGDYRH